MRNNIGTFFQICLLIAAWGILMSGIFAVSGCGRQEAEFLEADGQLSDGAVPEMNEPSGLPEGENQPGDAPSGREAVQEFSGGEAGEQADSGEESTLSAKVYVDVCGAVAEPGVYQLDADSRVFHAIEAAGGILPEAAGEYINQAEKIEDGQQIYIPTRTEAEESPAYQNPLEKGLSDEAAGKRESDATDSGKVNLNTADEDALTALTGIGVSKAQAILAYREEHGGFSAIEEILNVPGIKEGTFVKIKDNIAVE